MEITLNVATLAEVFGQTPEDLVEAFGKKDAEGNVIAATPEDIAAGLPEFIKTEKARYLDEGKRIGSRTRMAEFEDNLRKKFKVEKATQGEALVDAIVDNYMGQVNAIRAELEAAKAAKKDGMTDDEAKAFIVNHPYFSEQIKAREEAVAATKAEFEQYKQSEAARKTNEMVVRTALEQLDNYGPVESADETIKRNLRNTYAGAVLSGAKFRVADTGAIEVLDTNGEPLKDKDYRILTFEQYAAQVARGYYAQHPADPGKGAPKPGGGGGIIIPDWSKMSKEQIYEKVLGEKDPTKKQQYLESAAEFLK